LVQILDPLPGERILDLGCGDGALTESLIETGATVVGADSSPNLVAAAKARGIDARLIDGTALPFEAEFDGVFSNAALHWMRPAEAVVAGVARALVTGGRFVGEFGGAGNVEILRRALHQALSARGLDPAPRDPWYFPSVAAYRELLESKLEGDPLLEDEDRARMIYVPTVTRESFRTQGRIQQLIDDGRLFEQSKGPQRFVPDEDRVMLCGSMAMIKDHAADLERRGFEEGANSKPGQFVIERAFVG
jgi:SAM-dependent methyltransferase